MFRGNLDNPIIIDEDAISQDDSDDIEFIEERPVRPKQEPSNGMIDLVTVSTMSCFPPRALPDVSDDRRTNKHLISLFSTSLRCSNISRESVSFFPNTLYFPLLDTWRRHSTCPSSQKGYGHSDSIDYTSIT